MSRPAQLALEPAPIRHSVVLVADPSPTIRKIVQLTLEREKIRVITASDGLSTLAAVADEYPGLILLAIQLPRMDGYHVCRIIRNKMEFRHTPILLLSVRDAPADTVSGRLVGASGYLTKPFDAVELVQTVKKHLGSAPY